MWDMIARDITAPYSAIEAWVYDTFIAGAVTALLPALGGERVDGMPVGARVLDVGCGGGQNAIAIAARRPDLRVTGVDLSPAQVARAQRRADKAGVSVAFRQGDALDLPFDDGAFDVVASFASIKHWPDQARGASECARLLAPGGQLLIVEADRGCRLDDARSFVSAMRIPRAMRPVALAGFRTWVAGQGLDVEDGRRLLADLPLDNAMVTRMPGVPAVLLEGTRAG